MILGLLRPPQTRHPSPVDLYANSGTRTSSRHKKPGNASAPASNLSPIPGLESGRVGAKAVGAFSSHHESPNSESISRREKIRCDRNEPTPARCITSNLIPMRLVADKGQRHAQEQYVIFHRSSGASLVANLSFPRYVQGVEMMPSLHIR